MKNKIIALMIVPLLLCGCTETVSEISSNDNSIETVSSKEKVSSATEETTIPATTVNSTDPAVDHRPSTNKITCDFVQFCKDDSEIYADDGTLLAHVTVEYPQVLTENEEVNEKINNTYIEFKNSVLQGNTPFFSNEELFERYNEYDITWNRIDFDSKLKYYDEKYISFFDYHLEMATKAAHPIHAYTSHTFSLETGELLTIDY
ncbi:MAG: hypothetical protein K2F60_02895, partial [Oscillospiraceae bacterium]|nr:hypothetical protein [Oscillospiraceae bacterium]